MSNYWDTNFTRHMDITSIRTIVEVGARYGDETIKLKDTFINSHIYAFECNPLTIDKCRKTLYNQPRVTFFDHALGDYTGKLPFYSFMQNNDGASSFLKRIDVCDTQKYTGDIHMHRLDDVIIHNNIGLIDLLCMDVQGYELNVLKGAPEMMKTVKYIIMEEPKPIINTNYLPAGVHSMYIDSPSSLEIKQFMSANCFKCIERIDENMIEDNVMYINTLLMR